ncbi:MAG: glycosyl transferase family 2 [Subtercola sp.]|nr:glycosyl transferase family 2 [Subtercola sp.]
MTDPTPTSHVLPPITAILVVRDDVTTVEAAIASVRAQDYAPGVDIVVAVAPGSDGTADVVRALAASDARLSMLEFRSTSLVVGLNEAIAAARTALIIRVDPRSVLAPDFAVNAVRAMERTDAAALVARTTPVGHTPFVRAVAIAQQHRLGLGSDPLAPRGPEAQTQSAQAHVIRRRTFIDIGLYNEEIRHGQGWELNERLREAGNTVWFVPDLALEISPPTRVVQLTRSLFAEGLWRGEFARAFPEEKVLRFALPPVIVLTTIVGFILGAIGFFGGVAGALGPAAVVSLVLFALLVVPLAYVLVVLVLALSVMTRSGFRTGLWFAAVLPFIHFSWGFGFIAGFVNLEGAADTVIVDFD